MPAARGGGGGVCQSRPSFTAPHAGPRARCWGVKLTRGTRFSGTRMSVVLAGGVGVARARGVDGWMDRTGSGWAPAFPLWVLGVLGFFGFRDV